MRTLPEGFVRWAQHNRPRLDKMQQRGTMPLFIKENTKYLRLAAGNEAPNAPSFIQYRSNKKSNGELLIASDYQKKGDYYKIRRIGEVFAEQGHKVIISPPYHFKDERYKRVFGKLIGTKYERKCPDLIIDGKFYEFESYERPWKKRKVSNMIRHGLKQSPRIIIDNTSGCSHRYIKQQLFSRIRDPKFDWDVEEVWVYEKGKLTRLYKKAEGQS